MRTRARRWNKAALCIAAVMSTFAGANIAGQTVSHPVAIPLPPMGWSSWNSFSNTVNAQIIMEQARAMVSSGMQKAGYQYINIDEGWWLGQRDAEGNIVVEAKAWPALAAGERDGDMSNIVRFIHGLGLKAGIYTDAGENGCSMYPDVGPVYMHTGSEGHYRQDFLQFAEWGFDYVKVDWCGGDKENLDPAVQYAEIARAIAQAETVTGHRLYFSLCEWGKNSPWTWAPNVGGSPADIWRVSGDIVAPIVAGTKNSDRKASFAKMVANFDQGIHPEAQHTGFYNDPDMMVLGMPGLTDAQNRVHMSLWAMSGAPLIVGADLAKLSPVTRASLTNRAVLDVDQDGAGLQAVKVAEPAKGLEVWSKPLASSGERAVLLLNRNSSPGEITVRWSDLGLTGSSVRLTDLWSGKQPQAATDSWSATVPPEDAVMLLVEGNEERATSHHPSDVQNTNASGGKLAREHAVRFEKVGSRARVARIEIAYKNPESVPLFAELRVNGQIATRIAFPPTASPGTVGSIWIQATLDRSGADNLLTFSTDCSPGPEIQSIAIE